MTLTLSKTSSPLARGERELVSATRAGDDRAFEDLYARYRDRILSFIVSRVHDHGRAEDIAQDVFMSALRRLRASDQTIAFKPWIYEIAKNACIDEFRRGSRSREVPLETDGEFVTDRQPTLSVVTPVAAVESKQRLDDLRGAFGGLSANHHQLLVMREFEGMTYDEIGDRLDMTRQMVESGLFRARRKLSEEYEELASGRRCEQVQEAIEAGTMQSIRALGVRERRRAARHLAHCQPCRHVALMAGVDEALVKPRSIAAKIAAFLPLPLWRWPWRGGRGGPKPSSGSHHLAGGLQNAAGLSEPVAGSMALGPTAAAVAVLALAGGGAGLAHVLSSPDHVHRAAVVRPAAGRAAPARTAAAGAPARSTARAPQAAVRRTASLHSITSALTVASDRSGSRRRSPSQPGSRGSGSGGAASGSASSAAGKSATAAASSPSSLSGGVRGTVSHVAGAVGAGGVGGGVSKTVHGALGGVGGVGGTLSGAGTALGNVIKTATGAVNQLPGTVNKVAGDVGGAVQGVGGTVQGVGGAVQGVGGAVQGVGGAVQGVGGAVQGLASGSAASSSPSTSSSSSSPGSNPLSAVTSSVSKTVQDATQPVQSAVGHLAGVLGSK
jgi:RNA polymerase sigma factor (sigma-70 family)